MSRTGISGQTLTLGVKFYNNGTLFSPFYVGSVKIYDAETGGNLIAILTPSEVSSGFFQADWNIPESTATGAYYDSWTWVAQDGMSSNVRRYSFSITNEQVSPTPEPIAIETACLIGPTWNQYIGIRYINDVGNGMGLKLHWFDAIPNSLDNQIYYNIYYSRTRFGVFSEGPKAITTNTNAIINVGPGKVYYFAIKATESDPQTFDISGLSQIGDSLYQYPTIQTLQEHADAYGATIKVADNSEFPNYGFIKVGYEVMFYSSKGTNEFVINDINRGEFGSAITDHDIGEEVILWKGVEDLNSNIQQATADYIFDYPPYNVEAIGEINADEDGYRAAIEDYITTNLTASDQNTENFSNYDYLGYHTPSLQDSFRGDKCLGSYLGGEFNGSRGFNFQDRILSQLDSMLQTTGSPIILLKRKWTGRRCNCISLRREHQRSRCGLCYGTGFLYGFDRYFNRRPISESYTNTQGMIMARFYPYSDDVEIVQDQGLRQPDEETFWTLTVPKISDRDIIVRFEEDNLEEFRYIVLSVTRNKLLFNQTGKQEVKVRRLDKTDQIYQYPTNDPALWIGL